MLEVRLIDGNRLAELFETAAERGAGVLATVYRDAAHFARTAQEIKPEVRHGEGCKFCKGRSYTKKPLTVITRTMKHVEVVFEYCPACGRKMDGGADNG